MQREIKTKWLVAKRIAAYFYDQRLTTKLTLNRV